MIKKSQKHADTIYKLAEIDDSEINIANAALNIGRLDYPSVDLNSYQKHLDEIAKTLEQQIKERNSLNHLIKEINYTLFDLYNYRGDIKNYNDPQNANIIRVIDRRIGLPVILGILYIHAMRSTGWSAEGLAFPGHFLIRLQVRQHRAIIDPFDKGKILNTTQLRFLLKKVMGKSFELKPSYYDSVSNKDILLRVLNNLKSRAFSLNDTDRVIQVQRRMTTLAPNIPDLWRDLGLFESDKGNIKNAMDAFQIFADKCVNTQERMTAIGMINQLKRKLH
ncbi:MAG: hypothetical protein CMM30_03385 [Rhodospirillaceae bacterium]|nr:hypothetical protein [Rhodospirillaceae bacterium]|tara:strand:- start:287 stop:1120 length:834 start_codon:yes stop_codon:yes gene_type:complete